MPSMPTRWTPAGATSSAGPLLQALIELAGQGTEERSLLESISNHVAARGVDKPAPPTLFDGQLFAESE